MTEQDRIDKNRALVLEHGQTDEAKDAFTFLSLDLLKNEKYKGIHTVYQGFNDAFRQHFPTSDPVVHVNAMRDAGKIAVIPVKKGVRLYWPEDKPNVTTPSAILAKMGL